MRYISTRGATERVTLAVALQRGIAPDGGLYLPESWPKFAEPGASSLTGVGQALLAPFCEGESIAPELAAIVEEAFNFPAPLVPLASGHALSALELFHGPTAAFKDFGARFLAACLVRLRADAPRPLTILVATSGDTGGAVASAFHRRQGLRVGVLFPKGRVSARQEQQLTCWGDNVFSLAVRGTFDDCQALVKAAFADPSLAARHDLSSANSINVARLLPQAVYYAQASLALHRASGQPASFVVPSGNLGNALAAVFARNMGLPIRRIVLAHNANRTVPDYLASGDWRPRPSIATLASAMDVGNPSNMERLRYLVPDWHELARQVSAEVVDDAAIRARIRADHRAYGRVHCPHTAVAAEAYARLPEAERAAGPWVIVATAHPAKFADVVEPLIGGAVPVPDALERILALPRYCAELEPNLAALAAVLA
jgi:threonine synthase